MEKKIGSGIIVLFIASYVLVMYFEYKNISSLVESLSQAGMFITGFSLWMWMVTDLFKRNRINYRAFWGWSLILFNVLAAIVYFVYTNYMNKDK